MQAQSENSKPAAPLTLDQTRAFEDILAVFTSPGWKHLEKQLRADVTAAADVRNVKDLSAAQAAVRVLDTILAWPNSWNTLYDMVREGDVEVNPEFGK